MRSRFANLERRPAQALVRAELQHLSGAAEGAYDSCSLCRASCSHTVNGAGSGSSTPTSVQHPIPATSAPTARRFLMPRQTVPGADVARRRPQIDVKGAASQGSAVVRAKPQRLRTHDSGAAPEWHTLRATTAKFTLAHFLHYKEYQVLECRFAL